MDQNGNTTVGGNGYKKIGGEIIRIQPAGILQSSFLSVRNVPNQDKRGR
jgi:hypothetical protein